MADDDQALEARMDAFEKRIFTLLESLAKGPPSGVLRLSEKEIDDLLNLRQEFINLLLGTPDGAKVGLLAEMRGYKEQIARHEKVLHGPSPEEAHRGVVRKVAMAEDRISTWVKVVWIGGGALLTGVVGLALKALGG